MLLTLEAGSAYTNEVLADGPNLYLRLDDPASPFVDSSGKHHPGTEHGTVTKSITGGLHDGDLAVTLDGTTGYITVVDHADLDLGDVFTLECWVKTTDYTHTQNLISKGTNGYTMVLVTSASHIKLYLEKQNVANIVANNAIIPEDGGWHHLVVTKSGTTYHAYVDAVTADVNFGNQTIADTAVDLYIGQTNAGTAFLNGSIDEVAIYPTALSAARVLAHYLAAAQVLTVGQATESDSAGVMTPIKARVVAVGQALETDTATAFTHSKRVNIGQAFETDAAQQIRPQRVHVLGQPTETDSATAFTHSKRLGVGQALETDTATAFTHSKRKTIGQALEADLAQVVTPRLVHILRVILGQPLETDTAGHICPVGGRNRSVVTLTLAADTVSTLTAGADSVATLTAAADIASTLTPTGDSPVTLTPGSDSVATLETVPFIEEC